VHFDHNLNALNYDNLNVTINTLTDETDLIHLTEGYSISRWLYNELSPEQLNSLMKGIADAQNGRLIPHEEVLRIIQR
jgi:predicted transcriptional regulator